jgi:hypothetical protein
VRPIFPRLTDRQRAYCVVDRADSARYRVREGVAGSGVPHELVHCIVECEAGGFWGAVADGAVFDGMEHLARSSPSAFSAAIEQCYPPQRVPGVKRTVHQRHASHVPAFTSGTQFRSGEGGALGRKLGPFA